MGITSMFNILDLFAGAGGMSLGFEMAGFNAVAAIEKDVWAAETYSYNRPNSKVFVEDITMISNPLEFLGLQLGDIDGIVGGPPCQGFSLSGNRDPKDPRNSLFMDYMRFVQDLKPKFFVMENVPGILSAVTKKKDIVHHIILKVARDIGYNVHIFNLSADKYGVPQSRHRVFFIGIRNDLPFAPSKLVPTEIPGVVTIDDAIGDLPPLMAGEGVDNARYTLEPMTDYQRWCRSKDCVLTNHVSMKHTPRLVERFSYIQYGQSIADVPIDQMARKRGDSSKISGKVYSQNYFRPFPDRPSPTIPASFQSNFIHPRANRNYTAREGARLQSFPDWYVFKGKRITMSWEKNLSQYKQIGNAVPPLLAKAIALAILEYLKNIDHIRTENLLNYQTTLW
jgi:DNA (cytosine-5)-methyltransferase 1